MAQQKERKKEKGKRKGKGMKEEDGTTRSHIPEDDTLLLILFH
jgi:hypothetical protein